MSSENRQKKYMRRLGSFKLSKTETTTTWVLERRETTQISYLQGIGSWIRKRPNLLPCRPICSRRCKYLQSSKSWHLRHSRTIRGEKIERMALRFRCRCCCWLDARRSCQHGKGSKFEDGELHVDRGGSSCWCDCFYLL